MKKKHAARLDALEKDQHTGKFVLSALAAFVGGVVLGVSATLGWFKT